MITVARALCKGHLVLSLPMYLLMFGLPGAVWMLQPGPRSAADLLPPLFAFLIGTAAAWLYWSYAVVKWRIRVFTNVDDIHELERKAIRQLLIYPRGHRFERLVFATEKEKEQLTGITRRLNVPPVVIDDPDVPRQTIFRHSLTDSAAEVVIGLIGIALGLTAFAVPDQYPTGVIFIIASALVAWAGYAKVEDRSPQITVDDTGIRVRKHMLYSWEYIRGEHIRIDGKVIASRSDAVQHFIVFEYRLRKEKGASELREIRIDGYKSWIGPDDLEYRLHVYRARYDARRNLQEERGTR